MADHDMAWCTATNVRTKRLLIMSQVYVPDSAAVGQCLADVAAEMARRGWHVIVYTAARGYDDPALRYPRQEIRDGVHIRRLPLSSFGKTSIPIRLLAQGLFVLQAFLRAMCLGRIDKIVVSTSPPFAGFVGSLISRLRCAPLLWWVMDLNPDQMVAAGKLGPRSVLVQLFNWMNQKTVSQASRVVVLDDFMRSRLERKHHNDDGKVRVIPPWSQAEPAEATIAMREEFRRRHGLQGKFVIMYAGNHAIQHPLDTLLDAAQSFATENNVIFLFIGGGAGKAVVENRIALGATNVRSLPYQPLDWLAASLATADLHVVSMGNDVVGIVHPCKIYGVMAVGRPILFFGPNESHAGRLVGPRRLGWRVAHGDVEAAVSAIREAIAMPPDELAECGARGAIAARESFSRAALIAALCDEVEQA